MKNLREIILHNRSYRRFDNTYKIHDDILLQLIEMVRFVPSAGNLQSLKYILTTDQDKCDYIFSQLAWAGYLPDWNGPAPEEQPVAYITVLKDTSIAKNSWCDDGIAIQTILLAAVEKGLGGCILGNVNRRVLANYFELPKHIEIAYVLALGKPAETVILEDIMDGNIKYWREEDGTHHVPKRRLDDLIFK